MHHHQRSLGGWSFAFEPYWEEDLTTYLDDPVVDTLYPLFDLKGDRDEESNIYQIKS